MCKYGGDYGQVEKENKIFLLSLFSYLLALLSFLKIYAEEPVISLFPVSSWVYRPCLTAIIA